MAVISDKCVYAIVEAKLGLRYAPESLDVNKACFAKQLNIHNAHGNSRFEAMDYFNL